jgi:hypothetical protein
MYNSDVVVLVVDDERTLSFLGEPVYARTAGAAIEILHEVASLDELWLDHDLGKGDDGYAVASYLEERASQGLPLPIGRIVIHSMNPVGAQRMQRALERFYVVDVMPYTSVTSDQRISRINRKTLATFAPPRPSSPWLSSASAAAHPSTPLEDDRGPSWHLDCPGTPQSPRSEARSRPVARRAHRSRDQQAYPRQRDGDSRRGEQ